MIEAKKKPRACVCAEQAMEPWHLVCNKCKVDTAKLKTRIQRARKKIKMLAFCKGCGHHAKWDSYARNGLSTYMIDQTRGGED